MINILDNIIEEGLNRIEKQPITNRRIDNIILGKSVYTMKNVDNIFTDMNLCLVLTEAGYGFSYFQEEIDFEYSKSIVNTDIKNALKMKIPLYLRVALADCLFSISGTSGKNRYFAGTLQQKATLRAKEIMKTIPKGSSVSLLGASSEIVEEAKAKNCNLRVIDFEESKIGLSLYGNIVENGKNRLSEHLLESDYIIATGMIFVTDTADAIFHFIKEYNKKLIIYMQTGSNIGHALIKYGAQKVLCEYFPYYDFSGPTRYSVFEKKDNLIKGFWPHFGKNST